MTCTRYIVSDGVCGCCCCRFCADAVVDAIRLAATEIATIPICSLLCMRSPDLLKFKTMSGTERPAHHRWVFFGSVLIINSATNRAQEFCLISVEPDTSLRRLHLWNNHGGE